MFSNEYWNRFPSEDAIGNIVGNIGNDFYNLCLEIGLTPPVIEQRLMFHDNFPEMMASLLQCLKGKSQESATIGRLLTAMEVCEMDWHTTAQLL